MSGTRAWLAPVLGRRGWERAAFVFFVLGVGCVPGTGVANVGLTLCLASTLVWRFRAHRRGEGLLDPFRGRSPVNYPIAAFVGLSVLSCFFSTLPSRSLLELKGFGTFLLVPFTLALLRDEADVDFLLDLWRVTAAYLMARGLIEYFFVGRSDIDHRLSGGMSVYMTYAGLLMALSLLLLGRALGDARRRVARTLDALVAVGSILAVGLTFTRNAYLGLAMGALALAGLRRPRFLLLVPLAGAAFYLAMPSPVRARVLSTFDRTDETARDRLVMWKAGALMIRDHPLFGVGPGRVKELYPAYRQEGFVVPRPGHLHNNIVMTAAETGIPSALAYLAFVGAFLGGAIPRARRGPPFSRAVASGAVAAMAALFVAGFFEYNFGDVEVLMATLVISALPFSAARAKAVHSGEAATH